MAGWRETVEAVLDAPGAVVLVGAVDVGKTTAATALANAAVRAGRSTAVVDADPGQSDLGPPATVGLGFVRRPVDRMMDIPLLAAFFVGDTSPPLVSGYLIDGTVRLSATARGRGAQVVVVDTTGWVEGATAVAAKVRKIRRIQPRHVIAIQHLDEVEPILARIPRTVCVHRLRPPARVRRRSRQERRAFREQRFARYFADARRVSVDVRMLRGERALVYAGRRVPPSRVLEEVPPRRLGHLLVGLADRDGILVAVGSIVAVRRSARQIDVAAPVPSLAGVRALQWGALRVAPAGREEGRLTGVA